jgi:hypothetical protein
MNVPLERASVHLDSYADGGSGNPTRRSCKVARKYGDAWIEKQLREESSET